MATPKKAPKKKKAASKKAALKKATKKKAMTKKAARKKSAKKIAGKLLMVARPSPNQLISTVHYEVKFFGGTGEINLEGENIDVTLTSDDGFDVSQNVGVQITTATGWTGGPGAHIDVTVTEGGSRIGSGSFSGNTFNSNITYTVK